MNKETRRTNENKEQTEQELKDLIGTMVKEIKAELGNKAGINEIEAALLKRQSSIMSKLMDYLAKDQDFPPSGTKK